MGNMQARIAYAALAYPVLLLSLCFHEFSHGLAARWFGDRTAEREGRLTMNPLVHIDPIGTVIFPLIMMLSPWGRFLIGWARPVPVNPLALRRMRDIIWVSLAGPASNFVLAIAATLMMKIYITILPGPSAADTPANRVVWTLFLNAVTINILLGFFNLIPLTPLDGSRVVLASIPPSKRTLIFWQYYEQYGFLLLLLLLWIGGLRVVLLPFMNGGLRLVEWFLGI